jgi:uncharacterized membrane protein YhaH (DUF805 family)
MRFLFSFSGRTGRLGWWGGQFALLLIVLCSLAWSGAFDFGYRHFSSDDPTSFAPQTQNPFDSFYFVAELMVIWWIWLAVTVKRIHDLGKSGWLILPLVLVMWFSNLVTLNQAYNFVAIDIYQLLPVLGILQTAQSIMCLVVLVCCGFISGNSGVNSFGPPSGFVSSELAPDFAYEGEAVGRTATLDDAYFENYARRLSGGEISPDTAPASSFGKRK